MGLWSVPSNTCRIQTIYIATVIKEDHMTNKTVTAPHIIIDSLSKDRGYAQNQPINVYAVKPVYKDHLYKREKGPQTISYSAEQKQEVMAVT